MLKGTEKKSENKLKNKKDKAKKKDEQKRGKIGSKTTKISKTKKNRVKGIQKQARAEFNHYKQKKELDSTTNQLNKN